MLHRVLPKKQIALPDAYATFGTLISQEYFEALLAFLTENQFEFTTISALPYRKKHPKLVALTFDDGYVDNFDFAYPSLIKFNATATFFPVVHPCRDGTILPLDIYYQCVDSMSLTEEERVEYITGATKKKFYWTDPAQQMQMLADIFTQLPSENRVKYMSEQQLKELSDNGFEIGSHGMTHALLTADYMNEQKVLNELKNARTWLEEITQKKILSFCFPSGKYNARMIELAKQAGYTSTCLVNKLEGEAEALPSYQRIFIHNEFNFLTLLK